MSIVVLATHNHKRVVRMGFIGIIVVLTVGFIFTSLLIDKSFALKRQLRILAQITLSYIAGLIIYAMSVAIGSFPALFVDVTVATTVAMELLTFIIMNELLRRQDVARAKNERAYP